MLQSMNITGCNTKLYTIMGCKSCFINKHTYADQWNPHRSSLPKGQYTVLGRRYSTALSRCWIQKGTRKYLYSPAEYVSASAGMGEVSYYSTGKSLSVPAGMGKLLYSPTS